TTHQVNSAAGSLVTALPLRKAAGESIAGCWYFGPTAQPVINARQPDKRQFTANSYRTDRIFDKGRAKVRVKVLTRILILDSRPWPFLGRRLECLRSRRVEIVQIAPRHR